MAQFSQSILPGVTGVIVAHGELAEVYRRDPAYTEVLPDAEVDELRGKALDTRLRELKLSTSGTVAEKHQRLREASPDAPTGLEPRTVPDPGVLTEEQNPDRDAAPPVPITRSTAPDRDAEQSKEN